MNIDSSSCGARKILVWIGAALLVSACAGYVPGRQTYWDREVDALCDRDGGVSVYEVLELDDRQYSLLLDRFGNLRIPGEGEQSVHSPAIRRESLYVIRERNPRVWRYELSIVKTSDRRVLGRQVVYARVGGDIPSPAHESSHACPEQQDDWIRKIIKRSGGAK